MKAVACTPSSPFVKRTATHFAYPAGICISARNSVISPVVESVAVMMRLKHFISCIWSELLIALPHALPKISWLKMSLTLKPGNTSVLLPMMLMTPSCLMPYPDPWSPAATPVLVKSDATATVPDASTVNGIDDA